MEKSQLTGNPLPPIIQVGDVLISSDILTEYFCCDYEKCKGICCVEGDAGAPVSLDEIGEIEGCLEKIWGDLSASAQTVIDKQGIAYTDRDGHLVTSIVNGKDCVFTCYGDMEINGEVMHNCCQCALEKAHFLKPVSCSLYPIREKRFSNGLIGLNYHRWDVCKDAVKKGKVLGLPVYQFLKEPLIRRLGADWYAELEEVAKELLRHTPST